MQRSDDELVAECLAGSDAAFRELVERHQDRIYSLALRMTGNRADAEDLAQDAFIRGYRALARYRPSDDGGGFGRWMSRITTNLCLNALRNGKRTVAVDPVDLECVGQDGGGPADAAALERAQEVRDAVQSLDERYRAAVVLRFMEDLSYVEIAEVLSVPVSTVETRLHRAKKRLRELLKEWIR